MIMQWLQAGVVAFLHDGRAFVHQVLWMGNDHTVPTLPLNMAVDSATLLLQFALVHVVSWGGRYVLWDPIAQSRSFDNTKVRKFSHIATACCFHTLSALFAYRVLRNKHWLYQRHEWSVPEETISADMKFFYLLYAARYGSDLVSLLFEISKEDTWAYAVHHLVTVGLVLSSARMGLIRVGGVLMLFLDWPDIALTAAKICKYLSRTRRDRYQFCADRLFEIFAVLFLLTRNVLFPGIVYVCLVDFQGQKLLKSLLVILVGLMYYWLALIVKTAVHQLFGDGSVDDLREDDVLNGTSSSIDNKSKRE